MRVFGTFSDGGYGGHGGDGLETWPSLKAAKASLSDRRNSGDYWSDSVTSVVDVDGDGVLSVGESCGVYFPGVTDDAYIELYGSRRVGNGKWEIDYNIVGRLTLGPRGGIHWSGF